jgi:hypothetical protein
MGWTLTTRDNMGRVTSVALWEFRRDAASALGHEHGYLGSGRGWRRAAFGGGQPGHGEHLLPPTQAATGAISSAAAVWYGHPNQARMFSLRRFHLWFSPLPAL